MSKKKPRGNLQFAALPCRINPDGERQVMLLTSRETQRWVIPKGWPIKGLKPRQVAEREAWEEAGLVGRVVGKKRLGSYHYAKRLAEENLLCEVRVFLFAVDQQLESWPEKDQRRTAWFDLAEATRLVDEGGLAEMMRRMVSGTASD
jgi:8-oxo-dGTP pyrophosphatase MutT (NUDIX family)